jgi:hypothetical protein
MSEITIQSDVAEKMAKYVAAADPILAKSATLDAAIPGAVDALVARGAVLPDARDVKVAEFRADPSKLVSVLMKAAATSASIGQPATPPSAPARGGKAESDLAYETAVMS